MTLYVGTSGFAYKEWKPAFYPADLPQRRFLDYYGTVFTACEINATFYRRQEPATLARWADVTPPNFRFAVKAHRMLTHSRSIAPDGPRREFLPSFLESIQPLRAKLGVVLFQFPPHRERDDHALDLLIDALPEDLPVAFEF